MIGDLEIDPFDSDRMMYVTGATLYGADNLTTWDQGGKLDISVKAWGIEETVVQDLVSPPAGTPLLSAIADVSGFRHDDLAKVPTSVMTNPVFTSGTSIGFAELAPDFFSRVGFVNKEIGTIRAPFSRDGGVSWTPSPTQPTGAEGGIVAVAADGSRVVWRPSQGTASYSLDEGANWLPSTGLPVRAWIGSDRVNPNKFYGFAQGRFFVSADGGATFSATYAMGLPASWAMFEAMPGHEGEIWLAGGSESEGCYGIWHSADSGISFDKLAGVEGADVLGFGKAAPGKDYPAVYASALVRGVHGIFRSDDSGVHWVRINDDQHQYGRTWMAITGDPRIYGRVYLATGGRGIVYSDIDTQ